VSDVIDQVTDPVTDDQADQAGPEVLEQITRIEYQRPWLYPLQQDAIFDPKRIACIEATTKGGKTLGCIAWLVEKAMLGGGEGRNYWWVAPVGSQADIAYTRTLRYLTQGSFGTNRSTKTIVLVNGAILWFKGADRPDSLYGDDVHAAVIDEASRFKADAWHAVRSTVTATRGPIRLIGNVRGRKNWFYQIARRAEQGDNPELSFHRITAADAVAAGVLDQEEIDEAERTYPPAVFRELFYAEASDDGANPFGTEAIRRRIGPLLSSGAPRAWGWDLAKKRDWTVGIALDAQGAVCRFVRFQIDWGQTKSRIIRETGNTPALVDSTGVGDPIVEDLQRAPGSKFEGYHFTPSSKQKLMEGLAAAIQSAEISYPDNEIVFELEQFEYTYTASGVRYSAPDGFHDDCVCALALAVMHKSHARPPLVIPQRLLARSLHRH
jgi:hypothetical protein